MYTNIDPDEGIPILQQYINRYKDEAKGSTINREMIIEMMELVMRNNVFQFGNSWWLQNIGTVGIYLSLFISHSKHEILGE
jgi:hypothetical protein